MKTIAKLALGGLMLAGAAAATTAPASAGVAVGVNIGVPGVAVGYGYGNPCYRPYWYRPAWCGGYPVYSAPLFVNGGWYTGPAYYRYYGGARYFWIRDRWIADRADFHRGFGGWYRGQDWHAVHGWYGHGGWHDNHGSDGNRDGWDNQRDGGQDGGWHR
jgi:hypothetical protein